MYVGCGPLVSSGGLHALDIEYLSDLGQSRDSRLGLDPADDSEECCVLQFHDVPVATSRTMNTTHRRLGMASTRRSTVARTGKPSVFSQKPPPITTPTAANMAIHIPMLNEDTDPSIRPRTKKTAMMRQIKASRLQQTQNSFNFKSRSFAFAQRFSRWQVRLNAPDQQFEASDKSMTCNEAALRC